MVTREGCALITGGSRGIGAATARRIAQAGWPVALGYRSSAAATEALAEEIAGAGGRAVAIQGDVAEPEAAEQLVSAAEHELGPVLVLVNNAGIRADGLAPQIGDEDWDSVLDTNLSGAFRLTRRALRPMLRARFGRIVNVASVVGPRANPGQANYAAAKAGLIGLTKTVAAEVARRGITVNAVAPGFIDTDMTGELVLNGAKERIPARRAGRPEEVAACIAFLASDEASYVTGSTLTVDGGLSA
jgi:3-oxoacyl-[acyl-carrier protein] reductase